jgi:hypothetical protein
LVLEEVGPHHSLSRYMYMAVVLLKKSKSIHLKEESRIWKGLLPRLLYTPFHNKIVWKLFSATKTTTFYVSEQI